MNNQPSIKNEPFKQAIKDGIIRQLYSEKMIDDATYRKLAFASDQKPFKQNRRKK